MFYMVAAWKIDQYGAYFKPSIVSKKQNYKLTNKNSYLFILRFGFKTAEQSGENEKKLWVVKVLHYPLANHY